MSQANLEGASGISVFSRSIHRKKRRKVSSAAELPDEQPSAAQPSTTPGAGDPAADRQAPAETSQANAEEHAQSFKSLGISEWLDR